MLIILQAFVAVGLWSKKQYMSFVKQTKTKKNVIWISSSTFNAYYSFRLRKAIETPTLDKIMME